MEREVASDILLVWLLVVPVAMMILPGFAPTRWGVARRALAVPALLSLLYFALLMFGSLFDISDDADIDASNDGRFLPFSKLQLAAIDGLIYLAYLAGGLLIFQIRQAFRNRKSRKSAAFEKLLQPEPKNGPGK